MRHQTNPLMFTVQPLKKTAMHRATTAYSRILTACLLGLALGGCKDHRQTTQASTPPPTEENTTNGASINSGTSETIGVKRGTALLAAADGDNLPGVYRYRRPDAPNGVPVDTYIDIGQDGRIRIFVDQLNAGENCYRPPDDASRPDYWLDGAPLKGATSTATTRANLIGLQTVVAGIDFPVIEVRRVDTPSHEDLLNGVCR